MAQESVSARPGPPVKTDRLPPYSDEAEKGVLGSILLDANRVMEEQGWASVDVSYLAIEEIAKEVIRLRGLTASPAW